MKMCYRGVSYDRHCVSNLQLESPICRGVYTQTTQLKFMGQYCKKQIISLIVAGKNTRFLGKVSTANSMNGDEFQRSHHANSAINV